MTGMFFDLGTPIITDNPDIPDFFPNDRILSSGSLFLIDLNHSVGGPIAGVPVSGDAIPNIAYDIAADIIGSGTSSTLAGAFFKNATTQLGLERTSKGGLHIAASQTALNTSVYASIRLPDLIKTYLLANPGNGLYISLWGAKTRLSSNVATTQLGIMSTTSQANNYKARMGDTYDNLPASGNAARLGSRFAGGPSVLGQTYQAIGANAWNGTIAGSIAAMGEFIQWGRPPGQTALSNVFGSHVVYRAYVEDLMVSGRSFDTVDAIDYALYQAAIGSGGKYNGDVWTAPATLVA